LKLFLPSFAQFSPIQGSLHEHENVCFLSSAIQEPPLKQPGDVGLWQPCKVFELQ